MCNTDNKYIYKWRTNHAEKFRVLHNEESKLYYQRHKAICNARRTNYNRLKKQFLLFVNMYDNVYNIQ